MTFVAIGLGCVLLIAIAGWAVAGYWEYWERRDRGWRWTIDFFGNIVWNPKSRFLYFNPVQRAEVEDEQRRCIEWHRSKP